MGAIFARNDKAYQSWQRKLGATAKRALSGESLEVAVMHLAQSNPEYVVVGK
jgi:hypothetical protein